MNRLITAKYSTAVLGLFISFALAAPRPEMTLNANGLGPFRFGMTLDDANSHLSRKLLSTKPELRATQNCDYIKVTDIAGASFVFINSKLVRIDVDAAGIKSIQGIEVGESLNDALPKLRGARREPLDHVPDGSAFVIETPLQPNAMSFQFDHDHLVRMIAGDKKVIRYSEGCD